MSTLAPTKTFRDRRLNYLASLEKSYQELGYSTKLNMVGNTLEIFPKGYVIPKSQEEMIIEKWIN